MNPVGTLTVHIGLLLILGGGTIWAAAPVQAGAGEQSGVEPPVEDEAVPADPAKSYFHFLQAQEFLSERQYTAAGEEFEKALQFNPTDVELRYQYAEFLVQIQKMPEATRQLERCLKESPDFVPALRLLARFSLNRLSNLTPNDPDYSAALQETVGRYDRILQLDADDKDSLYELGKLYLSVRNLEKAEEYLTRFNNLAGKSLEGLYYLTLTYFQADKLEQALATIAVLDKERPGWHQIKMLKADILGRMNKTGEAEKLYGEMLDSSPSDPNLYMNYASLLANNNQPRRAIEILEMARGNSSVSGELLDMLGRLYRDELQYDKAVEAFKDAVTVQPSIWNFRYNLGVTYARMGDVTNGIPIFQSLVRDLESSTESLSSADMRNRHIFLLNLGFLYADARKLFSAVKVFETLRRDFPDVKEPSVYIQLATLYKELEQMEKAGEVIADGLGKMPGNVRILATQAVIRLADGQPEDAIAGFREATAGLEEMDTSYYLGLTSIYTEAQRYDDALTAVAEGLAKFPDEAPLYFQKATVLEKAKRYQGAEEALQKVLELDPENGNAWNYLGYMLIDYAIDVGRGIRYVKKALQFEPKNPAFLDSLGWGYFKQQKNDEALELLQAAAKVLTDDPTIFEHLGDVYAALGQSHNARDSYEKSLSTLKDAAKAQEIRRKIQALKPKLLQNKE
ncbi:MAG: tetratricopeptide repeat protein [Acidobacteria bacterium]|nr:tetratricopeptide repeat protein [Acidobacteriota bacterium]